MKKYIQLLLCIALLAAGCSANSQFLTTPSSQAPPTAVTQSQNATQQPATSSSSQTSPVAVVFSTTLSYGSAGTAVANVQQFLADEGLYTGRDTGVFDQATFDAVSAFEEQENLSPVDGIFGPAEETQANTIVAAHPDWLTTLSNNNQYQNVNGNSVQSPAYSTNGVPAGATAICADGTYSFSMHRSGTCSHHGGVSEWLQ